MNKVKSFISGHLRVIREYMLPLLLVYSNGSWLYFEFRLLKGILLAWLLALCSYRLIRYREFAYPNFLVWFLSVFPLISKLINIKIDQSLENAFFVIILIFTLGCFKRAFLFVLLDRYFKLIYFLCIISVVLGPLTLALPSVLTFFPVRSNELFIENGYYNLIIFTERVMQDFRIQSIFWEPGAWAFNLLFAFYWYIFIKKSWRTVPIFIIGVFLTMSTTGFFLMGVLLLQVILLQRRSRLKSTLLFSLLAVIFLVVAVSSYHSISYDLDLVKVFSEQIFDKLQGKGESLDDRTSATIRAFKVVRANWFWGIGRLSADRYIYVTSTLSEVSYQLGLLYLVVYFVCFRVVFNRINIFFSFIHRDIVKWRGLWILYNAFSCGSIWGKTIIAA